MEDIISLGEKSYKSSATLISPTGIEYSIPVYESEEMIDVGNSITKSNNKINSYYKDFAIDIQGYSYITDENWDSSGGVKAWGRLYFDKSGNNVLVTRLEGNWANYDGYPTVLKNQQALAYCIGELASNGLIDISQQKLVNVSGQFDFNTNFTKYINMKPTVSGASQAGGSTKVTIERNGSTWQLNLDLSI